MLHSIGCNDTKEILKEMKKAQTDCSLSLFQLFQRLLFTDNRAAKVVSHTILDDDNLAILDNLDDFVFLDL